MSAWAERWRPLAIVLLLVAWVVFGTIVGVACGCANARDVAVASLNGTSDFGADAERLLTDMDRAAQQACVDAAGGVHAADQAKACVDGVRARYARAWTAYRALRRGWLLAGAAVRAYDAAVAAKRAPNEVAVVMAVAELVDAEQAFVAAMAEVR